MPDMNDKLFERIRAAAVETEISIDGQKVFQPPKSSRLFFGRPGSNFLAIFAVASIVATVVLVQTIPRNQVVEDGKPIFTAASRQNINPTGYMVNLPTGPLITYSAGKGLSKDSSTGKVFELVRAGDPRKIILKLARSFKAEGELINPTESQPNYFEFSNGRHPTERTIGLSWTGTGRWVVDLFEQGIPKVRKQFPDDEEIKRQAVEIFAKTGFQTSPSDVELYKDRGRRVIGHLIVDGSPTDLAWEVDWNDDGQLQSASGHSVVAVLKGEYPTISEVAAVKRITQPGYFGAVADALTNFHRSWPILMRSEKPKNVVCTKAGKVPMLVWDTSGNAWITPGYVFENDQTYWWPAVTSLKDGLIAIPPLSNVWQY
jgi:hypothetical protein